MGGANKSYYKEGFKLPCNRKAAAVIYIGMIDLLFAHRFIHFLIEKTNKISSISTISSTINFYN